MPTAIYEPTRIQAAGNKPKLIDEFIGRVNSKQTPEFDEYTIVLKGMIRVTHEDGSIDVRAGQAVIAHKGEWIRYSTPEAGGAEYMAVCVPAFSIETVHRDEPGRDTHDGKALR